MILVFRFGDLFCLKLDEYQSIAHLMLTYDARSARDQAGEANRLCVVLGPASMQGPRANKQARLCVVLGPASGAILGVNILVGVTGKG